MNDDVFFKIYWNHIVDNDCFFRVFFLQFVKTLKKYLELSLLLEDDTRFHCRNTENIDILKRST